MEPERVTAKWLHWFSSSAAVPVIAAAPPSTAAGRSTYWYEPRTFSWAPPHFPVTASIFGSPRNASRTSLRAPTMLRIRSAYGVSPVPS